MSSATSARPTSTGVLSRTALATTGMAVQGLARFFYTLAIGRLAGPETLGDTSALLSVAVYLSLVLPAGLGVAASRYLPDPEWAGAAARQLRNWFWGSSAVLALTAVPIAWWISRDVTAAVCCAVLVFGYNAYVFTRGALMGEDRIFRSAVADTVSSLIAITALLAVLWLGLDAILLLPLALGYVVFAVAAVPTTVPAKTPITREQKSVIARFLRDATIGGLATGGLLPATMVFVRAFDSPVQAGLFAAALSLATPASLLSQAVNQVLVPHFSRLRGEPHALRRTHTQMLLATTGVFLVIFVPLVLLSPFLLSWLYGSQYAGGTGAMQVLLIIVCLISLTCAPSAYLVAAGRQHAFATIWLAAFITGTLVMVFVSPAWGMWGALLGFAVGGGGGSLAVITAGCFLSPRTDHSHAPKPALDPTDPAPTASESSEGNPHA